MLLHPTQATREPVPGEEQGTHLEPCAFCATANGATALTCWRCGADLRHGRLDELAAKRLDAAAPVVVPEPRPPAARPPAGVPIPTLYPSFTAFDPNATVPMTVALGLLRPPTVAPDVPVLDMATLLGTAALGGRQLADPQAAAPQPEPGTSLVPVEPPVPLTRKQRAVLAAGILATSTLAVLGGSMLLDHYETARVGAGWSASTRPEPAAVKLAEDPVETLRRQPTGAGNGGVEAVSATAPVDAAALAPLAPAAVAERDPGGATSTTPSTSATTPPAPPPIDTSTIAAPSGPPATTTAAAAAPLAASAVGVVADNSVRRRNPSRAARYAAARRDPAEPREPVIDRAAPAAPRPCTPGVAALGLCTP